MGGATVTVGEIPPPLRVGDNELHASSRGCRPLAPNRCDKVV